MLQFLPISSCRRWFEVILRRIYYVMSCVRPQFGRGGGGGGLLFFCGDIFFFYLFSPPGGGGGGGRADCFHPKWAVDSSYSWNVDCFQIRWRICHSVGIDIKGSSCNRVNAAMNLISIVTGCSRRQKDSSYFNLQRQMLLICCLINNAVTKSLNKNCIKVCSYTLFNLIHRIYVNSKIIIF